MNKELYQKYLDNTLTPEELTRFRALLSSSSDETLTSVIDDHWLLHDPSPDTAYSRQEAEVKLRIDGALAAMETASPAEADTTTSDDDVANPVVSGRRPVVRLLRRALRYAAILLLPLLAFTTYYYYTVTTTAPSGMMTVSAPSGSMAEAVLPDGTRVTLSHDSRLSYSPSDFNGKDRHVTFCGEGWFDVAHDSSSPFQVSIGDLTVCVLGTRFNVTARYGARTFEVALLEGRVELTTVTKGYSVILQPGQKAVYDRASGQISLDRHADLVATQAWKQHEMKFTHADLSTVTDRLAAEYGVSITVVGTTATHFTGVLPTDNLDASLRILKATFGLSYHVNGKAVTLRMKQ